MSKTYCDHPFRVTGDTCLNCGEPDTDTAAMRARIRELEAQLAEANARSFEHAKAGIADALMLRTEAELKKLLGPELDAAIARAASAEADNALKDYRIEGLQVIVSRDAAEIKELKADNAKLRGALEMVQWVGAHCACPWCKNREEEGHRPDCVRQAALSPPSAEAQEESEEK